MAIYYKKRPSVVFACVLAFAATLSACGGGDDTVVADPVPTPTPTPTPTPGPVTTLSSGIEQSGVLNYTVYTADGKTYPMTAVVDYAAPVGKITFNSDSATDAFDATTTDAWKNVGWPRGISAAVHANGNMGILCAFGTSQVSVSQNMTAVSDHTVLRGKSFQRTRCEGGVITKVATPSVFNADGTVLGESGSTLPVAMADAMFTTAGLDLGNNLNIKLRVHSYTAGGVTQYHLVRIYEDGLTTNSGRSATLLSQLP